MFPCLSVIFADSGYRWQFEDIVRKTLSWMLQIVRKPLVVKTFHMLSKRWVVERTFIWLTTHR
jgi:transposase